MREVTITKTYKVFKLEELSSEAQNKAFDEWCESIDYPYGDENEKVLDKFAEIFPINILGWAYGNYDDYIRFEMTCDGDIEEFSGIRLVKYIWNNYRDSIYNKKYYSTTGNWIDGKYTYIARNSNIIMTRECPLTGYYIDCDILEPLYEFLDNPIKHDKNFYSLMSKCLHKWLKACSDDYFAYYTIDNFKEEAESNDWEYLEDGTQFSE